MGISLQQYRASIGLYSGVYRPRRNTLKCKYNPFCKGTDIHLRTFISSILLTIIVLVSCTTVRALHTTIDTYATTAYLEDYHYLPPNTGYGVTQVPFTSTTPPIEVYGRAAVPFIQLRLLLAGDVETNPGPTEDTQIILNAISASDQKMTAELESVKSDIKCVRDDMHSIKSDIKSIKSKVKTLDENQTNLFKTCNDFAKKFESVDYYTEQVMGDLESMSLKCERDGDRMDRLEQQMNLLEADKLKCNLRIFGLPETETETKPLASVLDERVFSVMNPDETVKSNSLVRAERIGKASSSKTRLVIIEFADHTDKLKLFKYRDALRNKSIRISNDLSYCQRLQLNDLNRQGISGYFRNGILHTFRKQRTTLGSENPPARRIRTLDDRNRLLLNRETNNMVTEESTETSSVK